MIKKELELFYGAYKENNMKVGEKFKTILGTQYEIVEISENKVICVILSGLYKGGASDFDIEEVKRYLKQ